ncbi:hypothetical protein AB0C84_42835 [Actinomadura sp. NPDC048955]|uniref:hypothetical protein n=1 Tax=Actinomadura sp. NPDC048955 TaxID=3158228 RepID=UPI0033E9EFB2
MTVVPTGLGQLSSSIARHLGEDWTVLPSYSTEAYWELLRDDGAHLRIRFTSIFSQASLTVVGVLPGSYRDRPSDLPSVLINAATDRGPRAIAGDITRRLLPTYLPVLDRVRRFQRELAAAAADRDRVAGRILRLLPEATSAPMPPGSNERGLTVQWRRPGQPRATMELRGTAETADLQLVGIPVDIAVQICQVLSSEQTTGVRIDEEFPPRWTLHGTRSQDGTPILDITAPPGADTDERGKPYLRIYANDIEVHDRMSPTARRWRASLPVDEKSSPVAASAIDQEDQT